MAGPELEPGGVADGTAREGDVLDGGDSFRGTESRWRQQIPVVVLLVLMGILVALVIFANVPGIRAAAGAEMTKTGWVLTGYAGANGSLVPVVPEGSITADFGTNGQVIGISGCNRYTANYSVTDYAIRIGPPVGTGIACNDTGRTEMEHAFLSDLPKAELIRFSPDTLRIYGGDGNLLLEFNKSDRPISRQSG